MEKKHYWVCDWDNYYGRFRMWEADLTDEEAADQKRIGLSVFDNEHDAYMYEQYRLTD